VDKNIIVGYDPGTTVGIAILDTDGKLIEVFSQKNFSKDEVIKHISAFGRPIRQNFFPIIFRIDMP